MYDMVIENMHSRYIQFERRYKNTTNAIGEYSEFRNSR